MDLEQKFNELQDTLNLILQQNKRDTVMLEEEIQTVLDLELGTVQVASYLGLSKSEANRKLASGIIPGSYKLGGRNYIKLKDLLVYQRSRS